MTSVFATLQQNAADQLAKLGQMYVAAATATKQDAAQVSLSSIDTKVTGLATAAKQDLEKASVDAVKASTDLVKTAVDAVTAKLPANPATETTVASILGKIIAGPATEVTLASVLSKLIAAPATEAKQDAIKTSVDALTTKVIAAPATAANQALEVASLTSIDGKLTSPLTVKLANSDVAIIGAQGSLALAVNSVYEIDTTDCDGLSIYFRSGATLGGVIAFETLTDTADTTSGWTPVNAKLVNTSGALTLSASTPALAASTGYRYSIDAQGARRIRMRVTTVLAAALAKLDFVKHQLSPDTMLGGVQILNAAVTVDTELPAAAASADALANPTTPQVGADLLMFNGSSWDRARNNANATADASAAKTVSVAGATQTNFNGVGAIITLLFSTTLTGTTPTFAAQLQWSPDGGTTWLNYGPATFAAAVPSAANTWVCLVYPAQLSDDTSLTLAAFTTGATVFKALAAPLPRTWRMNYTLTGTTPSVTFATFVNYLS